MRRLRGAKCALVVLFSACSSVVLNSPDGGGTGGARSTGTTSGSTSEAAPSSASSSNGGTSGGRNGGTSGGSSGGAQIASITWSAASYTYGAIGSDLWPVTWTADDLTLFGWGDGAGFGPDAGLNLNGGPGRNSFGFSTAQGTPPTSLSYQNVWGGFDTQNTPTWGGKGQSLLSAGGTLYFSIFCFYPDSNTSSGCPSVGGNQNDPIASDRVAYSTDQGSSWQTTSWSFFDAGFATPISYLEFGQDNRAVPSNIGGPSWAFGYLNDSASKAYLLRFPATQGDDLSQYQILTAVSGQGVPTWSSNLADRSHPVATTPAPTDNEVIYDAPLGTYLSGGNNDGAECGQVTFAQAAQPWGPWTTFANYANWPNEDTTPNDLTTLHGGNIDGEPDGFSLVPQWLSSDGLTFWVAFACYGSGDYTTDGSYHDRFNLISGTLVLAN